MTDDEKTTVPSEIETDEEKTTVSDDTEATEDAEVADDTDAADVPEDVEDAEPTDDAKARRRIDWTRVAAYGVLPALALLLAMSAGFLKYTDNSVRNSDVARTESVEAAKASTIAILSYTPDKVDQELNGARDLLTGEFRDSYTGLINDVVIPGAKERQISAVATVPRAGSVSANSNHAVVLVFVDQTVVVGNSAPSSSPSSVRVTLDKVGDKWLISAFDPV